MDRRLPRSCERLHWTPILCRSYKTSRSPTGEGSFQESAVSKKKTYAQRAVGLASPVLPAPVAKVIGTRWGSRLFILLVPFLLATGVLTISWNNGIPSVNFDRARAMVVGQQVGQRVESEARRAAQEYNSQQQQQGATSPQPAYEQQPQSWQPAPQQQYQPQYQPQQQYQQQYQGYQQPAPPQQAAQPFGPRAYR
jgi:hypothetical protein